MQGRILGNYRLGAELGSGGMGTVYLATVERGVEGLAPGDRVAVKVVHAHLVDRPNFLERFHREGLVGRQIHHPNVVRTLSVGAEGVGADRTSFISMEYVEGRTLRQLLEDLGTVPEALLRETARQIAAGLVAIHSAGIIHRDLKPENFLITADDQVRIMDLGVARLVAESVRLTHEGHFAGSLYYAAPEQFRQDGVGPSADLYSVGVLLYELATGENPFRRDDAAGVVNAHLTDVPPLLCDRVTGVSDFFSEVVAKLLEKDPSQRFRSAGDFGEVLRDGESSSWWGGREQYLVRKTGHLPRIPVRRETGLYGRDEEVAWLRTVWAQAREGAGTTILVEGESGIGKTRLVDAFFRELEGEDVHALYGSYSPSGGIGGLSQSILAKFGAQQMEAALSPYLTVTPELVPAFAAMVKQQTPPEGSHALAGEAVHAVLCHLMRMLAEEKPVCWVVDDLHFATPDSRRMALSLARAMEGSRVLLYLTARPGLPEDEVAHFSRLEWFQRRALGRLSPREVIQLLQDAFKSATLAEKLGGKIAYKSDGVPFFVFEMIRGLKDGKFLKTMPNGALVETKAVREIEVPTAVRDLIEGRLQDLTREERAILDVGAVQGYRFEPDLIARVLERKKVAVLQDLAEIERRSGVARSEGSGYRFDHHQIQEVLYGDLPEGLRREYHSMVADALVAREGIDGEPPENVAGETAVLLATHHLRGSRARAGLPLVMPALHHLKAAYRGETAMMLADLALREPGLLEGATRADVLLEKVFQLDLLGRREEEREILQEVFLLTDTSMDQARRAHYRRVLGWHLTRVAETREAEQRLREAITIAGVAGDREEEAMARSLLGTLFRGTGRHQEGQHCQRAALAIARELGNRRIELQALLGLGGISWSLGRYEEAQGHYTQSLELARGFGDERDQAIATGNLGLISSELGHLEEARKYSEASLRMLRKIGDRRNEGNFTGNLGVIMAHLGRLADAATHHERSRTISREIGDRLGEGISVVNLGPLYAQFGELDRARKVLGGVVERFEEIDALQPIGYAIQALAEVAEIAEENEEAIRLYRLSSERMKAASDPVGQAGSLVLMAALLHATGEADQARESLDLADGLDVKSGALDSRILGQCCRAALPGGDALAAKEELQVVETQLRHITRMRAWWLLHLSSGDSSCLREARRLMQGLLDHSPEKHHDTMVGLVPLHRAIMRGARTD